MRSFIKRFKKLPVPTQRLLGLGVVLALVVALPLFVGAIVTQKFLITQQAASGEPSPPPGNNIPSPPPIATPTPIGCNRGCGAVSGTLCQAGLTCYQPNPHIIGSNICRNPSCLTSSNCLCPSPPPPPNFNPPICMQSSIPPQTGNAPLTVTLHGAGESGHGTGFDGYQWDFENNGSWDTGININEINHTYTQPGTYHPVYRIHGTNNVWSAICNYPYPIVVGQEQLSRSFEIFFKFDGVTDNSAAGANVTARFVSHSLDNSLGYVTPPIQANYTNNGVYTLNFTLPASSLPAANDYAIILKGEKHLHANFCTNGQTTHCTIGTTGSISLPANQAGVMSLNFIGVPLPAGDTYPQDDFVNAIDFARVTSLLSKPQSNLTAADLLVGDLNYDGRINVMDIFLIRKTLETRYD